MTRDQLSAILDDLKKHRPSFTWDELHPDTDAGWVVEVQTQSDPRTLIPPLARAGVMLIREDRMLGTAHGWQLTLREWRK